MTWMEKFGVAFPPRLACAPGSPHGLFLSFLSLLHLLVSPWRVACNLGELSSAR